MGSENIFFSGYVSALVSAMPECSESVATWHRDPVGGNASIQFDVGSWLNELSAELRPSTFAHILDGDHDSVSSCVRITFRGWGNILPILASRGVDGFGVVFSSAMSDEGVEVDDLQISSLAIPSVDVDQSVAQQSDPLAAALSEVVRLRKWLLQNSDELSRWRALAMQQPN
ncbi:hypothetical protein [Ponticaulis profundi]|uniref:AraC family transcriptional regulator n=1 Tax=Ponticaulis profundi TaxID=2665222 RepID=A0ABW1SCH9_9PROT